MGHIKEKNQYSAVDNNSLRYMPTGVTLIILLLLTCPAHAALFDSSEWPKTDFSKHNIDLNDVFSGGTLAFIQQCQRSLPHGCTVQALRIDAAGYQTKIIQHCDDDNIDYAIRAKTSAAMRDQIVAAKDVDWLPLVDRQGKVVKDQQTYRTSYCIGHYEKPFTLIIQRKAIRGQTDLDLDPQSEAEQINVGGYIYRAIATNRDSLSDSQIIHWYNQRAEDSENRIKELKRDFGGDTLPCSDFKANTLYFLISALSYNVFALMRQLLPEELAQHRATTLRWRLYAMAAKVVKTGRRLCVKLKATHQQLLARVLLWH